MYVKFIPIGGYSLETWRTETKYCCLTKLGAFFFWQRTHNASLCSCVSRTYLSRLPILKVSGFIMLKMMSCWIHFHKNTVWQKSEEKNVICQARDATKLNQSAFKNGFQHCFQSNWDPYKCSYNHFLLLLCNIHTNCPNLARICWWGFSFIRSDFWLEKRGPSQCLLPWPSWSGDGPVGSRAAPSLGLPPERQELEDVAQKRKGKLASLLGKYSITSVLKLTSS